MAAALVFWMGGVICPDPAEAANRWAARNSGSPLTVELKAGLRDLAGQLRRGRIDSAGFVQAVSQTAARPSGRRPPEADLLAGLSISPDLASLLDDAAGLHRLVLFSDYPRDWLERLTAELGLGRWFSEPDMLCTSELEWDDESADRYRILSARVAAGGKTMILIDADARRAAGAVRHRLNAIIYQGAWRLRRELRLRELLPAGSAS